MNLQIILLLLTWNVGQKNPDETQLESLVREGLNSYGVQPNVVGVGLQEVHFLSKVLSVDDNAWTKALKNVFGRLGYTLVVTETLVGVLSLLFAKPPIYGQISNVQTAHVRTGLLGGLGNFGAVGISMNVSGRTLCMVDSHLIAHMENVQKRIEEYHKIEEHLTFGKYHVLDHDFAFWMGDLNFRLDDISEKDTMALIDKINTLTGEPRKQAIKQLYRHDQLAKYKKEGSVFSGFQETLPDFPPTYKFVVGTNNYDLKRKPAWTDRILGASRSGSSQRGYKSHPTYTQSDHKPVSAAFVIG